MNLFQINDEIEKCIDQDTGEILDIEALNNLSMEKDAKIENLACWYKNLVADAEALKAEKNAFAEREKSTRNKAEQIKSYLNSVLNGEKFATNKCSLSFRNSEVVEVLDFDAFLADEKSENYLKYAEPTINKAELKKALKQGETFKGVHLSTNSNIQIK